MCILNCIPFFLLAMNSGAAPWIAAPALDTSKPAPTPPTQVAEPAAAPSRWTLERSDRLVGLAIHNEENQDVGRIEDLVLRPDGTLGFVVVSMLDDLHRLLPIPWSSIEVHRSSPSDAASAVTFEASRPERASVAFTKDQLKDAPRFERGQWPKPGEGKVFADADAYFRAQPGAQPVDTSAAPANDWIRDSELRNRMIAGTRVGEDTLGTLDSVFLDLTHARVGYLTVSLPKGRLIAMPWEALQTSRQGEKLALGSPFHADQLDQAPQFLSGNTEWIRMTDPNWVREMYGYYAVQPYWSDAQPSADATPAKH